LKWREVIGAKAVLGDLDQNTAMNCSCSPSCGAERRTLHGSERGVENIFKVLRVDGVIWRLTYNDNPGAQPVRLAGQTLHQLLMLRAENIWRSATSAAPWWAG
jgi:hypothetical protein